MPGSTRLYDISRTISPALAVWPGDKSFSFEPACGHENPSDFLFCGACGRGLSAVAPVPQPVPDEATFAVLGPGGISFWNPEEGMRDGVLPYSGGTVAMVACSGDGSRLATGGFDARRKASVSAAQS